MGFKNIIVKQGDTGGGGGGGSGGFVDAFTLEIGVEDTTPEQNDDATFEIEARYDNEVAEQTETVGFGISGFQDVVPIQTVEDESVSRRYFTAANSVSGSPTNLPNAFREINGTVATVAAAGLLGQTEIAEFIIEGPISQQETDSTFVLHYSYQDGLLTSRAIDLFFLSRTTAGDFLPITSYAVQDSVSQNTGTQTDGEDTFTIPSNVEEGDVGISYVYNDGTIAQDITDSTVIPLIVVDNDSGTGNENYGFGLNSSLTESSADSEVDYFDNGPTAISSREVRYAGGVFFRGAQNVIVGKEYRVSKDNSLDDFHTFSLDSFTNDRQTPVTLVTVMAIADSVQLTTTGEDAFGGVSFNGDLSKFELVYKRQIRPDGTGASLAFLVVTEEFEVGESVAERVVEYTEANDTNNTDLTFSAQQYILTPRIAQEGDRALNLVRFPNQGSANFLATPLAATLRNIEPNSNLVLRVRDSNTIIGAGAFAGNVNVDGGYITTDEVL